jgi:hypothetical protein
MRKPHLSRGPLVFLAVCVVCLFTVTFSSGEVDPHANRESVISDWTSHHVIYTRFGPMDRMSAAQNDPRARFAWWRYGMPNLFRPGGPGRGHRDFRGLRRDWSINLGSGGTAPNMGPAKFTFDVTATPSCSNDYAIFPVDASGSATQPNLVAFNNLYRGTAGGTGVCNIIPTSDDDGTDATVLWSYNVSAVGGAVTTSPVISWDVAGAAPSVLGTKVAFVESKTGSPAHFHVLAWKAGQGQDTTDANGLQNALKPAQVTTFTTSAPASGSGTATDLALGTDTAGTDTLSSPFVDYTRDVAYVGNDIGVLYRIKDVFCPSFNKDAGCVAGLAPSLDTSWGTGGAVSVGACGGGVLTSPVEDFVTGNVFVGCSDGRIYGFNSSGAPLSHHYLGVGDGSAFGGVVVAPIIDGSNGLVYAVSGTDGTSPVVVQTNTSLSVKRTVPLGTPAAAGINLSEPTFNADYFASVTSSTWAIFSCGFDSSGTVSILYAVGFDASRAMSTTAPPAANQFTLAATAEQCSPLTEFINVPGPPASPTDQLFLSLLSTQVINSYNITGVTGAGFPGSFADSASDAVAGGTSDIIVDNESSDTQASSIYFSTLRSATCGVGGTGFCAVKLTQAGLN